MSRRGLFGPCGVRGCDHLPCTNGLCKAHNRRRNRGKPIEGKPLRLVGVYSECTFKGCGKPHKARGFCTGHLEQVRTGRKLSPLAGQMEMPDLLWSQVDRNGPILRPEMGACWVWIGRAKVRDYGQLDVHGHKALAHRASWELANGPIPAGLHALHRCDNPPCVRPDHLFLGTHRDNMRDMAAKGRHVHGARSPNAKLSDDVVREILRRVAAGESQISLDREFGLSVGRTSRLVNGKNWRHVTRPDPTAERLNPYAATAEATR